MAGKRLIAFAALAAGLVMAAVALAASGPDQTAPALTLSAPVGGSTLSGTTTLSAAVSDDVGIASVQFKLDGSPLGAAITTAPYQETWDTTTASNATHTITAVATDTSGNSATVNTTITVLNAAPPPPPPGTISVTKVFEGSDTDRQTHTFNLTAPVPAGDTLILANVSTVDAKDGTGGIVTPNGVTDSAGDVWHQDGVSESGTSFETVEVWSTTVATGLPAGAAVYVQGYSRGLTCELAIFAVSGLAGPDKTAAADGTYSSTQATPFVTTSQAHELLVGVHGQSSASAPWWTPESVTPAWTKWTDRFDGGNIGRGIAVEIREVTSIGSYRAAGKAKSAVTGNNLLVTYRAAG
ncbi:MAG TPA: Ig-like domain-containing protein [Gaiellaceae bacterium]|nr:Ig-like domain-containing protein [Gaiellaceae bacterium]